MHRYVINPLHAQPVKIPLPLCWSFLRLCVQCLEAIDPRPAILEFESLDAVGTAHGVLRDVRKPLHAMMVSLPEHLLDSKCDLKYVAHERSLFVSEILA